MIPGSRAPSQTLIVDTNIILSAALGARSRATLEFVSGKRPLVTSVHAGEELGRVAVHVERRMSGATEYIREALSVVSVANEGFYGRHLDRAGRALRLAVASRNGSTSDAHVLALAWTLDADIWSHDRDFAGTGWPSWSSANLRDALADG